MKNRLRKNFLKRLLVKVLKKSKPLDSEIQKIVNENFCELL